MRCRHKTPANAPLPFRTMAQWATSPPLQFHALWIVRCRSLDFCYRAEGQSMVKSQDIRPVESLGKSRPTNHRANPSIVWRMASMLGISLARLASSWDVTLRGNVLPAEAETYWISAETAWKHSYCILLIHKEEPGISRDIAQIFIIDIILSARRSARSAGTIRWMAAQVQPTDSVQRSLWERAMRHIYIYIYHVYIIIYIYVYIYIYAYLYIMCINHVCMCIYI